jgi:hypothetical protein
MIRTRKMRWAVYARRMARRGMKKRVLVGQHEGKKPMG